MHVLKFISKCFQINEAFVKSVLLLYVVWIRI